MKKWKLFELKQQESHLHENIIDILFKHKKEISRKLGDIRGHYDIDHISINIINPINMISIFSITPSVEYNLIPQGLWRYDNSFFPSLYNDHSFFWWSDAYSHSYFNEIMQIKEKKHNFSLGFNLIRKIEQFQIVYSYATRSQKNDLKSYYKNLIPELFILGDYGYKLIADIYEKYSGDYSPPYIENNDIHHLNKKSYLKLIINNTL